MESQETQKIKLYSYSKVWNIEKKIYSFQNFVLPAPVNPMDVLYFLATMGVISVIGNLIPALQIIPGAIRYLVAPYVITTYMRKKKLDGKNPIKYLIGYLTQALFIKGNYLEGFKMHIKKQHTTTIDWQCSYATRIMEE